MKKKLADELGEAYIRIHKKSLRAKLSKLRFDGAITIDEYKELLSLMEKRDKVRIINWLSSFNTESATACYTAVQRLKESLNDRLDEGNTR